MEFRQSLSRANAGQWSLTAIMLGVVSYMVFAGLTCFACQLCENVQFALSAIHAF